MEKITALYQKFRAIVWIAVAVIVVIIGVVIWRGQARTDVLKGIDVQFEGYNNQGTATINNTGLTKIEKQLVISIAKANKLDKSVISYLDETDPTKWDDSKNESLAGNDTNIKSEFETVFKTVGNISPKIRPNGSLSNGDKVTLKLDITKVEADHYKLSQKAYTFKVKGLKKTTNITANDITKNFKFVYTGYSNYGSVAIISKKYAQDLNFSTKHNGSLKNGEKLTFTLPKSLTNSFKGSGKIFTGSRKFSTTVSGLKTLGKVSNLSDVTRFNDEAADDYYQMGDPDFAQYASKQRLNTYIFTYNPIEGDSFESRSDSSTDDSRVQVVEKKSDLDQTYDSEFGESSQPQDALTEASLYAMTSKDDGKKVYIMEGFTNLSLSDGKLDVAKQSDEPYGIEFDDTKSVTSIEQQILANGEIIK